MKCGIAENFVRGPITEHVVTCACGKILGGFADIAGITVPTQKRVHQTDFKV